MSLLCRSSCFPGAFVKETVEISQLLRGGVGLMGGFFRACTQVQGRGRVHRDTDPIIRCMRRDVIRINTCHQHLVRTTTTTRARTLKVTPVFACYLQFCL